MSAKDTKATNKRKYAHNLYACRQPLHQISNHSARRVGGKRSSFPPRNSRDIYRHHRTLSEQSWVRFLPWSTSVCYFVLVYYQIDVLHRFQTHHLCICPSISVWSVQRSTMLSGASVCSRRNLSAHTSFQSRAAHINSGENNSQSHIQTNRDTSTG